MWVGVGLLLYSCKRLCLFTISTRSFAINLTTEADIASVCRLLGWISCISLQAEVFHCRALIELTELSRAGHMERLWNPPPPAATTTTTPTVPEPLVRARHTLRRALELVASRGTPVPLYRELCLLSAWVWGPEHPRLAAIYFRLLRRGRRGGRAREGGRRGKGRGTEEESERGRGSFEKLRLHPSLPCPLGVPFSRMCADHGRAPLLGRTAVVCESNRASRNWLYLFSRASADGLCRSCEDLLLCGFAG